jgi:hypothetical protein
MTRTSLAIYLVVMFGLLVGLAYAAWRRKQRMQESQFSEPLEALEFFGELLTSAKIQYVATTFAANALERINAYGLGHRGFGQLLVFTEGALIVRNGERPLALDRRQLLSVSKTQTVIDKSVEPNGLLSISWLQDNVELASHLRLVDSNATGSVIKSFESINTREASK